MIKFSIIIINYNNAAYLKRSINSAIEQTYHNKEIIVYDDCSIDNSRKIISKFKNVKKIFNFKKIKSGCQSQINGVEKCLKIAKGNFICLLDSDDFFKKNKLKKIATLLRKEKQILVTDRPFYFFNHKKILKIRSDYNIKRFFSWPHFVPQSCITIEKNFLKKNYHLIKTHSFDNVWMDFRMNILCFLKFEKIKNAGEYLTYYQQNLSNSASSKFLRFRSKWWSRRLQAHSYFSYLKKKTRKKKKYAEASYVINKLHIR